MTLLRLAVDQSCVKSGSAAAEKDVALFWERTIGDYEYLMANPWGPLQDDMRRLSMEIRRGGRRLSKRAVHSFRA